MRVCPLNVLLIMAVRGGMIRFAHPAGSVAGSAVQLACASCRTPNRGFSSPPRSGEYTNKNAQLLTGHFYINDGGEGGIRTPDTLPYTHFPGVLLQPLGHLTTFCLLTALGQRGATIGSSAIRVKGYFLLFFYSLNLCADCLKPLHFAGFVIKTFLN